MADVQLIIDDEYCNKMAEYFVKQGEHLDSAISKYISTLRNINHRAVTSGEVAEALGAYIEYATKLNEQMGGISENLKTHIAGFLKRIDDADEYLF